MSKLSLKWIDGANVFSSIIKTVVSPVDEKKGARPGLNPGWSSQENEAYLHLINYIVLCRGSGLFSIIRATLVMWLRGWRVAVGPLSLTFHPKPPPVLGTITLGNPNLVPLFFTPEPLGKTNERPLSGITWSFSISSSRIKSLSRLMPCLLSTGPLSIL